jgi:hypothetical protein
MTRRKKSPAKRGRKPAHPEGGAVAGAARSARYRARIAGYEKELASSWLRLASAAIAGGDLLAVVTREIEALRGSPVLDLLRSRLAAEDRDRLDAIAGSDQGSLPEAGIPWRDEIPD